MITEIKFDCNHCGQPLVVDSDAAGLTVTCPGCQCTIQIPRGGALPPAPRRDRREPREAADAEAASLRQRLVDANVHASRLEGEVAKARAEAAANHEARLAAARKLEQFEDLLAAQHGEIERLQTEAQAHRAAWESAMSRLRSIEGDFAAAQGRLRESELGANELRAQLAAIRSELAATAEVAARLKPTEEKLAELSLRYAAASEKLHQITGEATELRKERDDFRRTLAGDSAGQDYVATLERLRQVELERNRLSAQIERVSEERDSALGKRRTLEDQVRNLLKELDGARRDAEANSEHQLKQDNAVLRGIVERQNGQLEQQHVQLRRLRFAQYGVRLAYALFGFGLVALAWWAFKTVPGLRASLPF